MLGVTLRVRFFGRFTPQSAVLSEAEGMTCLEVFQRSQCTFQNVEHGGILNKRFPNRNLILQIHFLSADKREIFIGLRKLD